MNKQYTNEITPSLIAILKTPYAERPADTELQQIFSAHTEAMKERTLLGIWRFAVKGAVTHQGGKIEHASGEGSLPLINGKSLRQALVGDYVVYPDGHRARIISGSGFTAPGCNGVSFALVGSHLDNGDVIVSTPQDVSALMLWDNSPALPADFLVPAVF